ncbi:MAG: PrsW family intramembrane metalloprotease [Halodesulfurarchaeum sp.]
MTLRRTLRIARWEATRSAGSVDRRTAVAIALVLLVIAGLIPAILAVSPAPGEGLYRVGVTESSPYAPVVESTPELQAVDASEDGIGAGSVDLYVTGTQVVVAETDKGRAAAAVLKDAVQDYNNRLMATEEDVEAAFPVTVSLTYAEQTPLVVADPDQEDNTEDEPTTETEDGREEVSPTADDGATAEESEDTPAGGEEDATGATESGTDGQTTGEAEQTDSQAPTIDDQDEGGIGGQSPMDGFFGSAQAGTPSSISPPFPLESLILAFVFLLPFNVVIQAYGSSVIGERIDRRGEVMLVSPATRGDIIAGKALPYFLGSMAITVVIALVLGAGLASVAAIAPLALLFIAATFLAGLLSRSYKELTFTTVTISVLATGYAFLPAVFAEVHPIAAISPLTVVVTELQGAPIALGDFVFATLPPTLTAGVLFVLGAGIYREEDLFTQRPLPQKGLDALAAPLTNTFRVGLFTALFIPFVLVAELLAVATLFILPVSVSIPILLAVVAVVEELAKSIHVYAGFERHRFDRRLRTALLLGAASGVGFFVAEKFLAVTQLVGLANLELGQAAFAPEVIGLSPVVLLVAPLLLHVTTAAIAAIGASRSGRAYLGTLSIAILVHLGYNLAVVGSLA